MKRNKKMNEKQKISGKENSLYHLMLGILFFCAIPILLVLSYWACRYSYYETTDYSIRNVLVSDSAWKHILVFLLAAAAVYGMDKFLTRRNRITQERICLWVLLATCVAAFLLGVFYVRSNPYYPVGDQIGATAFAAYSREGNYIMLSPGGYVGMYQQQKGLGFLYEILFTVCGNFNYTAAKILHVVWWMIAILSGYGFLKWNADRAVFRIIYCLLMLGCTPFLLYLPYIYGDIMSISFCLCLFWALTVYEHTGRKRYLVLAAFVAALALLARKNTWIVLIGVGIYALLLCLKKENWRFLLAGAIILLAASLAVKAVDVMYEYRSGYPDGIGIPSILWIAMGMQETDGMAGVYNRYQQSVFEDNDFQPEPSAEIGKEYIRNRLKEFRENPSYAVDFYKNKLEDQWIEPLFSSLKATETFEPGAELPSGITDLYYGRLHDVVWKLANYYQSVVYLAGLALALTAFGMWWKREKVPAAFYLPLIAIVGGFLFSIIWEAQCRYVFPYYVFLILYVPGGLYAAGQIPGKIRKQLKKDNTVEQTSAERKSSGEVA